MPPFPQPATARPAPAVPWPSLRVSTVHSPTAPTNMVRTRDGSRIRPRFRFSIQRWRIRPQLPSRRSLNGSGDIRPGWDPGPLPQCRRDDLGGPSPPTGPGHQTRGSPRHLGLSHRLPQHQRRAHRPIYRRPRGSGSHCLLGPRYRGTWIYAPGIFMESHFKTCQH